MAPGVRGENKPTPGGKTVSGPPRQTVFYPGRRRGEAGARRAAAAPAPRGASRGGCAARGEAAGPEAAGGARGCGLRSIRGGRSVHWRSTRRSAEAGGTGALRGGVTRAPKSPERRAGGDAEGPRLHKSGCFSPLLFIFLFLLFVQRVAQPPGDSRVVPPCGECHASRCSPCTTHAAGTADMGCPGTSPGHRRRGLRASLGGTAGSGGWFSYSYF